jgi:hypothetical protein
MNKLFAAVVVSTFGLSALSVLAADLTNEERAELRQRTETLQADRLQNPDRRADDVRLNQQRGEVRLNPRGELKTKATKSTKAKRSHVKKKKAKRSVKNLPGALVR